jgi:hypothetical protein
MKMEKFCSVESCPKAEGVRHLGMCNAHYQRMRKYGTPTGKPTVPTTEDRFWSKVEKTDDCWLWKAGKFADGYGTFRVGRKMVHTHRHAWIMEYGEISDDLELDHICLNRACVRLDHLRLTTHKQNMENRRNAFANSKSGARGVVWAADRKKWRTAVGHGGKCYRAGQFDDFEEAKAAVLALRLKLHTHNELDRRAA